MESISSRMPERLEIGGRPDPAEAELALGVDANTTQAPAPAKTSFGEVYQRIQAQYGEKPEKPREIKKALGKDDFLNLMINQLKNQDPTNPFKAEQMATELAQFTSVEQLQNVNQNIGQLSAQSKPMEHLALTHLIGKTVTLDPNRFSHLQNQSETLSLDLPQDATGVHVAIIDEHGQAVYEADLGPQPQGRLSVPWNGYQPNHQPAKSGQYLLRATAENSGRKLPIASQAQGSVCGVSFEGPEPILLIAVGGNMRQPHRVKLNSIVRVEDQAASAPVAPKVSPPPL